MDKVADTQIEVPILVKKSETPTILLDFQGLTLEEGGEIGFYSSLKWQGEMSEAVNEELKQLNLPIALRIALNWLIDLAENTVTKITIGGGVNQLPTDIREKIDFVLDNQEEVYTELIWHGNLLTSELLDLERWALSSPKPKSLLMILLINLKRPI